ncbi:MAG: CBS domain-containing protein [Gammaproteobacteria bacterium]|nr:CBS domain-containing protein [Gammaproteobacteria bacterium]
MMQPQSNLQSVLDFLRRHAPFNRMAENHLEFLAKRLKLAFVSKDEVITGPDEGVASRFYILKQGRVRGETPDGRTAEDGAWELVTGESFPIGALLAKRAVHTLHRAVEDSFVYELERDDFQQLFNKSPVFQDFCTRRLASLLDTAMREMRAASAHDVTGDSSLNTPLRNLLPSNRIQCLPDTPVRDALLQMEQSQRRSIAIVDENEQAIGLITLRDVMSRVTLPQVDISTPVREVMTKVTDTLSPSDFAYEAALQMAQSGIGHVCIAEEGRFVGLVSERDLFSLQRVGLGNLSRAIKSADDIPTLKQLRVDMQQLVSQMMAQGASVEQLTQLISTLNDHVTQRIILICQAQTGRPAMPFTWLSFGSEGRLEQTLKTDQDNGILFTPAPGQSDEEARKQLLPLASLINEALNEVGFPLCPGNIMARNPECCLSLEEWKARFAKWVEAGTPDNLLKSTIFFDFRTLYGPDEPVEELRRWLLEKTAGNSLFRRMLAENCLRNRPPLGLFGDFKLSNHGKFDKSVDLKLHGITPFVDGARLISLQHKLAKTNTLDRLRSASRAGALSENDAEAWINAYGYIQLLRMRNHQRQAERGEVMHNYLEPDALNSLDRRILKEAFRQARKLQTKLSLEYQL